MSVDLRGYEAVIGLEVHVQLMTASKLFSGATTAYGADPNTQACPVDLALPGTLPVLNREAVRMAIRFGLAINAELNRQSTFERKNYFYPDLPKGYQISQFDRPVVGAGVLAFTSANGAPLSIRITRAHLEEDAGKSVHDLLPGQSGIDLNRAGTPLLEVVSEPDLRTAADAAAYFKALWSLVRSIGICDGQLQEGSMRCDANVSVRKAGAAELGVRTEIKNVNSFRFVEKAIDYEIERQIDVLEAGGTIIRETRLYDAERNETRTMRVKESSEDYRYFPDPDLLPLILDESLIEEVRASMPELPTARAQRYESAFALTDAAAVTLADDPDLSLYFEAMLESGADPRLAANWLINDVSARLNESGLTIESCPVTARSLGQLVCRIKDGTLSSKTAKTVFDTLWSDGGEVDAIINASGLRQMDDRDALHNLIGELIAANPDQVTQFRAGKSKVLGFFVGQVMQKTKGTANPKVVNELLAELLKS
jgi:aspartyl-tRNA(Asn)/glutamyl-tRNA(Gln) amidotransferase subunit B